MIKQLVELYDNDRISDRNLVEYINYLYENSTYNNLEDFLKSVAIFMLELKLPYENIESTAILGSDSKITEDDKADIFYLYNLIRTVKTKEDMEKQIEKIKLARSSETDINHALIRFYNSLDDKELIDVFEKEHFSKRIKQLIIEGHLLANEVDDKICELIYSVYRQEKRDLNFHKYLNKEPIWFRYIRNKIFKIQKSEFEEAHKDVKVDFSELTGEESDLIAYVLAKKFIEITSKYDLKEELFKNILYDIDNNKNIRDKFNEVLCESITLMSSEDINMLAKKIMKAIKDESSNLIIKILDPLVIAEIFARHIEVEKLEIKGDTYLEKVILFLKENENDTYNKVMGNKITVLENKKIYAEKKGTDISSLLKANESWLLLEVKLKKADNSRVLLREIDFTDSPFPAQNSNIKGIKFLVKLARKLEKEYLDIKIVKDVLSSCVFEPFSRAVRDGDIKVVEFLVKLGIELERDGETETAEDSSAEEDAYVSVSATYDGDSSTDDEYEGDWATEEYEYEQDGGILKKMLLQKFNILDSQWEGNRYIKIVKFLVKACRELERDGETGIVEVEDLLELYLFKPFNQVESAYHSGCDSDAYMEFIRVLVKVCIELEKDGETGILKRMLLGDHRDYYLVHAIYKEILKVLLEEDKELAKDIERLISKQMFRTYKYFPFDVALELGRIEEANFLIELARKLEEEEKKEGILKDMVLLEDIHWHKREIGVFLVEKIIQYKIFKKKKFLESFKYEDKMPSVPALSEKYSLIFDILQDHIESSELVITVNSEKETDIEQIKKIAEGIAKIEGIKNITFITNETISKQLKETSFFAKAKRIIQKFFKIKNKYNYYVSPHIIENKVVLRKRYKTDFVVEIKFDFNKNIKDLKFVEEEVKEANNKIQEIYTSFKKDNLDIDRARNFVIQQLLGCRKDIFKNIIEMWLPNTRDELLKFDFKKEYPILKAA